MIGAFLIGICENFVKIMPFDGATTFVDAFTFALLIIILSSVTTNVMNLYSSAISFVNVFPKIEPWKIIVGGGVAITGVAVIPNLIGHFIQFLTIVGSIFVPLIAILLVDYFLLKSSRLTRNSCWWTTPAPSPTPIRAVVMFGDPTQVGTVLLCRGAMRSAKQAAPGA